MSSIIKEAVTKLTQGEQLVFIQIVSQRGSTPRTSGAKMLVSKDGNSFGTIGGGLLEARAMQQGRELFDGQQPASWLSFNLDYEEISSSDMICGGDVEILLYPIFPTEWNIAFFRRWHDMILGGEEGISLTIVRHEADRIKHIEHYLIDAEGQVQGHQPLSDRVLVQVFKQGKERPSFGVEKTADSRILIEPITKPKTAILFGAGHVAQPTAHLAALCGFRVVVLDDRQTFAHPSRFPDADEVRAVHNFERALDEVTVDKDSFIIIVTRGHLHDKTVLAQALKTNAVYIGMIGSKRKRDKIYQKLLEEGFTEADLKRVHSPIGLAIKAETPTEIAVSIVAELIQIRASKDVHP